MWRCCTTGETSISGATARSLTRNTWKSCAREFWRKNVTWGWRLTETRIVLACWTATAAFIAPNLIITLLVDYLAESRGWSDAVARSVATTHLVDRVAARRGIEVIETPVGFKFIGQLINEDKISIGGEESAGLSIRGHFPEKDGLLACLLAAEMVARRGDEYQRDAGSNLFGRGESGKRQCRRATDAGAATGISREAGYRACGFCGPTSHKDEQG